MKILSVEQTRQIDAATIAEYGMRPLELMERASLSFVNWFESVLFSDKYPQVHIFCGSGNNGGDGLAIARLLTERGYDVSVSIIDKVGKSTIEFLANKAALDTYHIPINVVKQIEDMPVLHANTVIIDAILGSGLNRAIEEGLLYDVIYQINVMPNLVVAVDCPTGLFSDAPTTGIAVQAAYTCAFEYPKLSFLFPESYQYVGDFVVLPIGLSETYKQKSQTCNYYITPEVISSFFKLRQKFAHKGVFGHALLIVGSYGKMGAAILATKACLRTGAGLVTSHVPICGYDIMQTSVPEAMVSLDEDEHIFSRIYDVQKYTTVALGCGLSTKNKTRNAVCYVLKHLTVPVVLDADALNILGQSPDWFEFIPKESILTPHPKEFERMFGATDSNWERFHLLKAKAKELGVYIILKGANTCVATPNGDCYFNSTGNPGMGTAGSGDVLTGILAALLSQHYTPLEACLLGVYLHGLAGDVGLEKQSQESLTAGDIIENLGAAFKHIYASL